jgi:hypothetical protein
MRTVKLLAFFAIMSAFCAAQAAQPTDDATKKLGVLVGKWKTEGALVSGPKTSSTLECRWSPMGSFLVSINW